MPFQTIAGTSVGGSNNEIVRWDKETGERKMVKIKGRYLYITKCVRDEIEGGIVIPEKSRTDHTEGSATICLVLAIGDKCGKPIELTREQEERCEREPEYKYMMDAPVLDVKVGDKILCPDTNAFGGILNSPYDKNEFFVRDSLPFAKIEE
jgi:co-chaperonin GroES (HSP10)